MILPRIKNFSDSTFKKVAKGAYIQAIPGVIGGALIGGGIGSWAVNDGGKGALIGSAISGTIGAIHGGIDAYRHRNDDVSPDVDWSDAENSLNNKYDYDYKKFIVPQRYNLSSDYLKLMKNQKKFTPEIVKEYRITKDPRAYVNIPVMGTFEPTYTGSNDIEALQMDNPDDALYYNTKSKTYNYGSDKSYKSLKEALNDYYKNPYNSESRLSKAYIKHVNRVL
jgi:hypothetical protein